jgi:hypothetical protein
MNIEVAETEVTYEVWVDDVRKSHGYADVEWAREAQGHIQAYHKNATAKLYRVTTTREEVS